MATSVIQKQGGAELLWSGTWESGTITVPNTDKYTVFLIVQETSYHGLAPRLGNTIRSFNAVVATSGVQTVYGFRASISGNSWTLAVSKKMTHTPSSNHGASSDVPVNAIYGII